MKQSLLTCAFLVVPLACAGKSGDGTTGASSGAVSGADDGGDSGSAACVIPSSAHTVDAGGGCRTYAEGVIVDVDGKKTNECLAHEYGLLCSAGSAVSVQGCHGPSGQPIPGPVSLCCPCQ